jgi:hypothetical protein
MFRRSFAGITNRNYLYGICLTSLATFVLTTFLVSPPVQMLGSSCASSRKVHFGSLSTAERLALLSELSGENYANTSCDREPWRAVYDQTSVEIIIGSYDRPQELRSVLLALQTFVTDEFLASVLTLGSEEYHSLAYTMLATQFPQHTFFVRNTTNYFELLANAVSKSPATNFVIMSDDTTFIRPCSLRKFATLQNLLETDLSVKFSVQLRISSRDPRPGIFADFLPTWGLPYAHIVDCSPSLGLHNPNGKSFFSCCYDRQIDGSIFTARTLEIELKGLHGSLMPTHPGELEGFWMASTRAGKWKDLTIIPVDRLVLNSGLSLGTVRTDRRSHETNEDIARREDIRALNTQAYLEDCYFQPIPPGILLDLDATHVSVEATLDNSTRCTNVARLLDEAR